MGQIASILGNLLIITAGIVCYLIFNGNYTPNFKKEKQRQNHFKLVREKGYIYKMMGILLALFGVYRLIMHLML